MKAPTVTRLALLALLLVGVAPAVHAQDGTAYYGLSIGELDYSEDVFDDTTSTWHLMVGYMFTEHLGVEGAYGESDTIRDTEAFGSIIPGLQDEITYETALDRILTIRLVGMLPFGKSGLSLIGGVGYADIKQELAISVNGLPLASGDVSANNPTYFGALQYDFERIAIRLGYEKYDFDGDVDGEETSLTFFYKL
jgi:hypothetical protein